MLHSTTKKTKKKIRCTKNANIEEYQADLASIDLMPILLTTNDVHVICKYYHDQVVNIMNKHYPFRTLTNEELKWIRKPWINKRLQGLIKEKNILYHKRVAAQYTLHLVQILEIFGCGEIKTLWK